MSRQYQLVEGELWSIRVDSEPPGRCSNCSHSDIAADRQVAEEQPTTDQWLFGTAWRLVHDLQVWRVKPKQYNTIQLHDLGRLCTYISCVYTVNKTSHF